MAMEGRAGKEQLFEYTTAAHISFISATLRKNVVICSLNAMVQLLIMRKPLTPANT